MIGKNAEGLKQRKLGYTSKYDYPVIFFQLIVLYKKIVLQLPD